MAPDEPQLFDLPTAVAGSLYRRTTGRRIKQYAALWTHNKASLIREYLLQFVQVTRHGIYLDGFAGPQDPEHPEAWSANRALEIRNVRRFLLNDMDPVQVQRLEDLRAQHHDRDIRVFHGDFNENVVRILNDAGITEKTATVALLDQRTAECEWETVQTIAAFKAGPHKIELFYFLMNSWLGRSLKSTIHTDRLDKWWGSDGWRALPDLIDYERAELAGRRFISELGYRFVSYFPILDPGGRTMFFLIHASDHERAAEFVDIAYRKVVGLPPSPPADQLRLGI